MKDEFYIDNVPVDIEDSTDITLNFKSNLFTDVSKIVSNNSYSIKLPMTVHNRKVIEHAYLPACSTNYMRINHKGRYIRNGVEIVSDANVSLIEVVETIDVALAWGNISKFATIASGNKKLTDLGYGDKVSEDYLIWKKLDSNNNLFPRINYGFKDGEGNTWYHPVVTAKWILDKISADSGVTFNIPSGILSKLESLIIPLLSRNDSAKKADDAMHSLKFKSVAKYKDRWAFQFDKIEGKTTTYYGSMWIDTVSMGAHYSSYDYDKGLNNSVITASVKGSLSLVCTGPVDTPQFELSGDVGGKVLISSPASVIEISSGKYRLVFNIDEQGEFSHNEMGENTMIFRLSGVNPSNTSISEIEGNITYRNEVKEVSLRLSDSDTSGIYYIVPNLPDIKQIEFIKLISNMFGLFAMPGDGQEVIFYTMDDVIANKKSAVNWTKQVIASYPDNRPKGTSFTMNDFAQNNIYAWKDDEDGKFSGGIKVDDETIDYEKDVYTAPFAPSETRNGIAYIPLYSYNNDGELEYDDGLTPRILLLDETIGTFIGLDWDSLINENYSSYQRVIRNPLTITELIEIKDYELKTLNMSVPCYLGQYGKYFAIISIKAEKTGVCECKLFNLE